MPSSEASSSSTMRGLLGGKDTDTIEDDACDDTACDDTANYGVMKVVRDDGAVPLLPFLRKQATDVRQRLLLRSLISGICFYCWRRYSCCFPYF